ncbi:MAG: efflux transporter outer membrane subunit [Desulfovibrio sp.]|jgi:NodT family efflux transporter outer membrane factor (OMF) lipoprotein|nr:efflux transporter outer membrane subunit [Desulfovibrio sp.]
MKLLPAGLFFVQLAAFLPACSLAPVYVRPDSRLPNAAPASWTRNGSALEAAENDGWWAGFNSRALVLLQREARAQNRDFAASGRRLAQAIAQSKEARASLFPWIGAEGAVSRAGSHPGSTGAFALTDAVSGGFQASYELDLWGRVRSQAESAAFAAEATLNDWRGIGLSLESDTAIAYFQLLALRERLALQRDILSAARQTLAYMEKQQRAGAATRLDLARQRGDVASMHARAQDLARQEQAAKNALNNLLGAASAPEDLDRLMSSESITILTPPAVVAGLPSSLLFRRPDILAAEASLKAANADIGPARAAFLPLVNLTAQGGWQSDEFHSLFRPDSTLYALVSSLVTPIFQGGRLAARHEAALARREELVARYQQAALFAFLETDTAIAANTFLLQEEEKRGLAEQEAREAYRLVRVQYREGSADFLSLLDAQRTLLTAQDARVTVSLARLNAAVSLFKALGGGWGERMPSGPE